MSSGRKTTRFGLEWSANVGAVEALIYLIRKGGQWKDEASGRVVGAPLFDLYREMQTVLWGDRCEHHEWSDLILKTILAERITAVQGPSDSSKTHCMARYALTDYFCFPTNTLILMSSTDIRGLELRVWGEVKDLFNLAREKWHESPGFAVDSMHGIFTDEVGESDQTRDIRKGLVCLPILDSKGQYKGMGKWVGIKQKRRRVLGDEVQFYASPYLSTLANLNKGDFKGVFVGNPIGNDDPLDKIAEPVEGWDGQGEVSSTCTWRNRMDGVTIQLYGPDSPGIRYPDKYPYMKTQADIDRVVNFWGKDSMEYWNQAIGVRRPGVSDRRVVTREMARLFGALEPVVWRGGELTSVYALDAAYGGDRCVGGVIRFGQEVNGGTVISCSEPVLIPVKVYPKSTPESERVIAEDQIAAFVKADCERQGVPAKNVFFDSTGRGSLGTSFARLWSAAVNPIEFGGNPTPRPVTSDTFIYDDKLKQRRLKRADEHYSKKVTELWFSIRYVVEGRQMRDLPASVLDELCAREWTRVKGDKIELESKEDMKPRFGRSPDMADWLAIAVEGARRLGFNVARLEAPQPEDADEGWKDQLRDRAKSFNNSFALNYST